MLAQPNGMSLLDKTLSSGSRLCFRMAPFAFVLCIAVQTKNTPMDNRGTNYNRRGFEHEGGGDRTQP
jgi:hypothetical protein